MDRIADQTERDRIAQDVAAEEPVWWMTSGWIKYRKEVFKGWDTALDRLSDQVRHLMGS